MSVYYIYAPEIGLVKIGHAVNVANRFASIQTGSPTRLVLLATEDGDREMEAERHRQFASARVRGEWFHYASVREHIDGLMPYVRLKSRKPLAGALGKWLMGNDHTLESFGKIIGRSKGTISGILRTGECPPGVALEIELATNGEVSASMLSPIVAEARAA